MLRDRLSNALKDAMRAKDARTMATVRLILAALKDRDIAARSQGNNDGISEHDVLGMLQSMIKQRHDSIAMYEKGGRLDLSERDAAEIEIIKGFLPEQMEAEAVVAAIAQIVAETEATSLKDMGRVMGLLKERYAGRMDFAKASGQVKAQLG